MTLHWSFDWTVHTDFVDLSFVDFTYSLPTQSATADSKSRINLSGYNRGFVTFGSNIFLSYSSL